MTDRTQARPPRTRAVPPPRDQRQLRLDELTRQANEDFEAAGKNVTPPEQMTATVALGVALSVAAPMLTMDEAQERAPAMREHLRALGYVLGKPKTELDVAEDSRRG